MKVLPLLAYHMIFFLSRQQEEVKVLASIILGYCLTVTILVVLLIYFGTHLPHLFKNSAINLRQSHRGSGEHSRDLAAHI